MEMVVVQFEKPRILLGILTGELEGNNVLGVA